MAHPHPHPTKSASSPVRSPRKAGVSGRAHARMQARKVETVRKEIMAALRGDIDAGHERRGRAYETQPGALASASGEAKSADGGRRGGGGGASSGRPVMTVPMGKTWESANRTRRRATNRPYAGMADAFLTSQTHAALRNEARQCGRRFSLSKAILTRWADLAISDGFIIKCTHPDEAYRVKAQKILDAFFKSPTVRGRGHSWTRVLRRIIRAFGTDGDIGLVRTKLGSLIEEIQSERIVNPGGVWMMDTDTIIGGVEMNDYGAALAYHVQGRKAALTTYSGMEDVKRVRAEDVYFCVSPLGEDSGQTRGIPFLTWAIPLIELSETFIEDTAIAAKIATLFGIVFKIAGAQTPIAELDYEVTDAATGNTATEVKIEPAFTTTIGKDDSIEQVKPEHPTQNARDFDTLVNLHTCASVGLPLMLVLMDPSQANFHSMKSAIAVAYRGIRYVQEECIEITRWAAQGPLSDAIRRGELPLVDDYDMLEIIVPPPPTPDLLKDVEAWSKMVNLNLATKETATRVLDTGDSKQIAIQRGKEVEEEKRLKITPIVAGSAPPNSGGAGEKAEEDEDKKTEEKKT